MSNVIDVDDEIVRLNAGTWPSLPRKVNVIEPQVLELICAMGDVLVFYSYIPADWRPRLRALGFRTVLIDVSIEELLDRHAQRAAAEGWDNSEWTAWNSEAIEELVRGGHIDHVVAGERPVEVVSSDLLALHRVDPNPA